MSELYMGLVTGCKSTDKGVFIDILGFNGTYYTNVETFLTPGLNEIPIPANIPLRDSNIRSFTGEPLLHSIDDVLNSPANTYVLYVTSGPYENMVQTVIPIRFFKNYAQASSSPPKWQLKPQPGEVAVQAAGTDTMPGGFVYFDKYGNATLSSAGTCSLTLTEKTGKAELLATRGSIIISPFTITIENGELMISRNKYTGPGSISPIIDVTIKVTALGDIKIEHSPTGTIPQNIITLTTAGGVEIKSQSKISIDAPQINLNSGSEGIARVRDDIEIELNSDQLIALYSALETKAPIKLLKAGRILSGSSTVKSG